MKMIATVLFLEFCLCGLVAPVRAEENYKTGRLKTEPVAASDLKLLKVLDETFKSKNIEMSVDKVVKIPLLGQERKTHGKLWISSGRVRMTLDGSEKTLLIVNKINIWAVTFPPVEFKDAAIQVIKADAAAKNGKSQNLIAVLSRGGFLKFFVASAVQKEPGGSVVFFLNPRREVTEFKRAQVKISNDGKKLLELNYWDDRDNETRFSFSDFKFDKKPDDKMFIYSPPANAEILNL